MALTAVVAGVAAVGLERIGALAWAATAYTAPFNGVRLTSFIALSDVFLAAAVAATFSAMATGVRLRSESGRSPARPYRRVLSGLALIALGGMIGTFFAATPEDSLVILAKFVVAAAGSVLAVALWAPGRHEIRWFCGLWVAGATTSAVWAFTGSITIVGRPVGLTNHPNHLGLVCLLGVGLALGMVLDDGRLSRLAGSVAGVVLLAGLMASGSRAALVGLVFVVPVVAILSGRVQLGVRAAFCACVLGVAVLAGVIHVPGGSAFGRLLGGASTTASDIERGEHLDRSIERFRAHPLTGEGFEFAQEAHNIYLQALVVAGPIGLVGVYVMARSVMSTTSRAVRRRPARRRGYVSGDRAVLAGMAGGYAGYLAAGMFQNILWDRYLWLYVAAALALAGQLDRGRTVLPVIAAGTARRRS